MNARIVAVFRIALALTAVCAPAGALGQGQHSDRGGHSAPQSNTEIVTLEGEITAYEKYVVSIARKGKHDVIRVRLDHHSSLVREATLEGKQGEVRATRVAATPSALKRGARVSVVAMREGNGRQWRAVSVVVRADSASLPLPGRPPHEQPQPPRRLQSTT